MTLVKKQLFVIEPDHVVDIITNSSSELFVLEGETKQIVEELVSSVYPDYLSEYKNLKTTEELSEDELDIYISYHYDDYSRQKPTELIPGFTWEEMYQEDEKENSNSYFRFRLKRNHGSWRFVTAENKQRIINGIDPNRKKFWLFSIDENPNWDMQESLMNIGTRYRLG